jgi:arylsulfatase A-like enzyme
MPNLIPTLLPDLKKHRLASLDLGDQFIYPKYTDQSILNIPSTLCRWLGVPDPGVGPLRPEIISSLGDELRRVVLVLMDALALHRLQRWLEEGVAPVWDTLAQDGVLAPLTSIVPSTTSAATTSLWTGHSSSSHGIVGYEVWLKEYSLVANMIQHSPMSFRSGMGDLRKTGFKPDEFLPIPTLGTHLRAHGVTPFAFQHYSIAHSGLSQMILKDVEIVPFSTLADLWISLRKLLEIKPEEHMYVWAYWSAIDNFSHHYHPDDERVVAEFTQFSNAFEQFFLNRLSKGARKDTLLLLTADHGQVFTPRNPQYLLKNHPQLVDMLHMLPTGENRLMYLHVRPGQARAVQQYFSAAWPGKFSFLSPKQALQSGLFGPGAQHPDLYQRLGDLIVISREDAYLWWAKKDNFLVGRHGGLLPEEMLVPFLAVRL